ncbi:MAG: nitroreductase family protein [Hyphomicrobiaceae bacterium]
MQKIEPKAAALAERYGADAVPAAGPWNDVIASLLGHKSVRGYRPDPLPSGTLETLIAAAQSAATSSNLQTWSVIAVNAPATRAELASLANNQKHIEECPLFLAFCADLSRNERLGKAEGKTLEALPYVETFLVAAIDAALAAQNAVVAAESLGLSTVYIGAMRNNVGRVAELLALPPGVVCVFGLCVGYPKPGAESSVKPRLAQSAILFHERYDASRDEQHRHAYDAELARFSKAHEMSQYTWSERVLNRMGPIKSMSGRHTLKAALRALGIPLG